LDPRKNTAYLLGKIPRVGYFGNIGENEKANYSYWQGDDTIHDEEPVNS
jgi:hypothetical protein